MAKWLTIREALEWLHEHYGMSRTNRWTLNRLMTKGCPTTGVVMQSWIGPAGKRLTTVEWIEQFYRERSEAKTAKRQESVEAVPESPARLSRRYAKAAEANRKAGIR